MNRFLLKRKADGLWRKKIRPFDDITRDASWTADISKAQVFKSAAGCMKTGTREKVEIVPITFKIEPI